MSRLVGQFRCIGMELPHGHGDGAPMSRYRHEDLAADLLALLDHLELPRCYTFGSSFGSTITLRAMHAQPERIPRAILQGGFARRPLSWLEHLGAGVGRWLPGQLRRLPLRQSLLSYLHRGQFEGRPADAWRFHIESQGEFPTSATAFQALLIHATDVRSLLSEIRQPVLLVSGTDDRIVPRWCEDELLRGLPNARQAELQGCGHVPHHSHPEALAEVVRHFLTPPRQEPASTHAPNHSVGPNGLPHLDRPEGLAKQEEARS
jgi:pimeloyl-ACP methyl ester carboxylesterase